MRNLARALALVLVFGGTGAAGLLAEQAFEKLLGNLLGNSTPAGAAVLSTYFGGLFLGGLLYARWGSTRRAPLRLYAALEATVAIACILLALGAPYLGGAIAPFLALGAGHAAALTLLRLVVAASWLLPITVPMGATLPALVDALDVVLPGRRDGGFVSALYTANLVGAIAAAAAGPYLVLPAIGLDGTLWLAAGLDITAAAVALALAAGHRAAAAGETLAAASEASAPELPRPGAARVPEAIAAVSGFVLFALEVTWTHLLGTVLGHSVYAFATMLTVVLTGLGLGSALAGVLASRLGRVRPHVPGLALIAAFGALTATRGRWAELPAALAEAGPWVTTFAAAERARALLAVGQLLPGTVLLGMVYPLVLRLDTIPRTHAGGVLGRIGAANALGSVVGAFLTLFLLLARLGADRSLRVLAGICLLSGVALVLAFARPRWSKAAATLVLVGGGALVVGAPPWPILALTSGQHVYLERGHVHRDTRLRYVTEDPEGGFTTVVETPTPDGRPLRVMLLNGKFQGNDGGEMTAQNALALLPMMFVPSFQDAYVVGLGTGRTAHVTAAMGFDRVGVAEMVPGIVTAARHEFAHINGNVLDRPNLRLVETDARNDLLVEPRQYDLLSVAISGVWAAGATNLYSREFYALCHKRLRPRGVLQQWIQVHHIGVRELETVIATVRQEFPRVSFFFLGHQGMIVAGDEPQATSPEFFARLERHAAEVGIDDVPALVRALHSARVYGPAEVDRLVAEHAPRINTDANRFLEYATPRHALERSGTGPNIRALAALSTFAPQPVAPAATGPLADLARGLGPADVRRALELE